MKIMILSPYFSPMVGGVETHLTDLCNYLTEKKHKVFVRTYQAMGTKAKGKTIEKNKHLEIFRLPWPDFNLIYTVEPYPLFKFLYIFTGTFFDSLFFLFKNAKRIDVIQAHGFIAAVAGVVLGKIFNKRIVINTHVGFKFTEKGVMTTILTWVLKNADKVLVLTKGAKKSLMEIGIPEEKIDIYHYWVDQSNFKPIKKAKTQLGWEKKFTVLFVGRLIEVKGVKTILDVAKKNKQVTFVIAGSGPLTEELAEKSAQTSNVIFLGKINNRELPVYYSAADVLIIPSKIVKQEYEEGIPRVMIEALSCGTPVITTPSGGIPDVFSDKIGLLVGDDKKSLSDAVANIYNNRRYLETLTKNARSFAVKLFSIKNAEIIEQSLRR